MKKGMRRILHIENDEEWSRVPEGECYDYGHLTFRADGYIH